MRLVDFRLPPSVVLISQTDSYYCVKNKQSRIELFCGITPLNARPTRETFRGLHRGPGGCRGTCRSKHAVEELLCGSIVAGRT